MFFHMSVMTSSRYQVNPAILRDKQPSARAYEYGVLVSLKGILRCLTCRLGEISITCSRVACVRVRFLDV